MEATCQMYRTRKSFADIATLGVIASLASIVMIGAIYLRTLPKSNCKKQQIVTSIKQPTRYSKRLEQAIIEIE